MNDKKRLLNALEEILKTSMVLNKAALLHQFEETVMRFDSQENRRDTLAVLMYKLSSTLESMQDAGSLEKIIDPKSRGIVSIVDAVQLLGLYVTGQTFTDASIEVGKSYKEIDQFYFTRVSALMDELYKPMESLIHDSLNSLCDIATQRYAH